MAEKKDTLLALIRDGQPMTRRQQLRLTALLSFPAILAELTSIIMQYIDASMVGNLGANEAASIGLVSTTLWLMGGVCSAASNGFSVQVAHHIGAKEYAQARSVVRQAIVSMLIFSGALTLTGVAISHSLPLWLGGNAEIAHDATLYFIIFSLGGPLMALNMLASGMLRCSGNIKVPSMLNIMMCVLDVIFNFFFIFPTHYINIAGFQISLPGANLGVAGAAIGTLSAEVITCSCMVWYLCFRSKELKLTQDSGSFRPSRSCLYKAFKISTPMGLQHIIMCSAQILITAIVAPLGSVALAANSLGVTAESLCYMPGYGVASAATALIGQCIGAGRRRLTKQFAYITVMLGVTLMTITGALLFIFAPQVMGFMTSVPEVVEQGALVLRIEAFAEPFFAAAIVSYGVFVGAGDTIPPCIINMVSMWGIRLTLSAILAPSMGLTGVWLAMALELTVRGVLYLLRLYRGRWIKIAPV